MRTQTILIYAAIAGVGYYIGRSTAGSSLSGLGARYGANPCVACARLMQQQQGYSGGGYGQGGGYYGDYGSRVEIERPGSLSALIDAVDSGTMIS